jgi:hypothetical protein
MWIIQVTGRPTTRHELIEQEICERAEYIVVAKIQGLLGTSTCTIVIQAKTNVEAWIEYRIW